MEKDYLSNIKVYRQNSDRLAQLLINSKITPNQITIIGLLFAVLSAYFFSQTDYIMILIAMVFWQLNYFFDHLDGSLARLRGTTNDYGHWLDILVGMYSWIFVYIGITIGVYKQIPQTHVLLLGSTAIIVSLLKNVLGYSFASIFGFAWEFRTKTYKKWGKLMILRYNHKLIVPIISLGAIFNKMYWVLLFSGIYGSFFIILQTIILTLKAYNYSKKKRIEE